MDNTNYTCNLHTITDFTYAILDNDLHTKCLTYLIIKFLGSLLFILSFTSKIPQIYSMIRKKTNKGLSLISLYSDFLNALFQGIFSFNKNLPLYIYGEYFSISLQNGLLVLLYWNYEDEYKNNKKNENVFKKNVLRVISTLILGTYVFACIFTPLMIPNTVIQVMGLLNLPITTISRVSQIILLINSKDAGCLSLSSNFMKLMKNCIKASILLIDVYNPILFMNQVYNGLTVLVIIVLIIAYNKRISRIKTKSR